MDLLIDPLGHAFFVRALIAAAVGYGVVTSRALLALSPGNEVMRGL